MNKNQRFLNNYSQSLLVAASPKTPTTAAKKWSAKKDLYARLDENSTFITDSTMQAFYDSTAYNTIGQLREVDKLGSSIYELNNSQQSQLTYYKGLLTTYENQLYLNDSLLSLSPNANDSLVLAHTNDSLHILLLGVRQVLETLDVILRNQANTRADNANFENANVSYLTVQDENETVVNDIYYKTIAKGNYNFDATELSRITSIASQCPISGGNAVFRARSLYSLVNDSISYDDVELCNQQGISLRKANTPKAVTKPTMPHISAQVVPNPTSNSAVLKFTTALKSTATVYIYTVMGQLRDTISLSANTQEQPLAFAQWQEGIYYYQVYSEGYLITTGKFVVKH